MNNKYIVLLVFLFTGLVAVSVYFSRRGTSQSTARVVVLDATVDYMTDRLKNELPSRGWKNVKITPPRTEGDIVWSVEETYITEDIEFLFRCITIKDADSEIRISTSSPKITSGPDFFFEYNKPYDNSTLKKTIYSYPDLPNHLSFERRTQLARPLADEFVKAVAVVFRNH